MARAGVTYHEVAKAAMAVKARGHQPTVDRVREHLGTGSKSTIAPLLKRWRGEQTEASPEGLPDELLQVVKGLYQRLQSEAERRIDEAKVSFEAERTELAQSLAETNQTLDQLTQRQQSTLSELEQLRAAHTAQRQALEANRIEYAEAKTQRDEATTQLQSLKVQLAELQQEKQHMREHLEHYQQRSAEERQQEREQFRLLNQQQQAQLLQMGQQLSEAQASERQAHAANAELQRQQSELLQSQAVLEQSLQGLSDEKIALQQRQKDSAHAYRQLQAAHDERAMAEQQLVYEKHECENERALLQQSLGDKQTALSELSHQVSILREDNRQLLQQKALLQGQHQALLALQSKG